MAFVAKVSLVRIAVARDLSANDRTEPKLLICVDRGI